jgi:hypothetical protein
MPRRRQQQPGDEKTLTRHLIALVRAVEAHISALDAEMQSPSTFDRGCGVADLLDAIADSVEAAAATRPADNEIADLLEALAYHASRLDDYGLNGEENDVADARAMAARLRAG